MYKIINISNNIKKFVSLSSGSNVFVNPKESVMVKAIPDTVLKSKDIWKVKKISDNTEKREEKQELNNKEVK